MIAIHEADTHAPFAHFLVTSSDGSEFVICGYCRHLVTRPLPVCRCIASCHAEARNPVAESVPVTYDGSSSNQTVSEGTRNHAS